MLGCRLPRRLRWTCLSLVLTAARCASAQDAEPASGAVGAASLPGIEAVLASRRDLWGEASLREPDGPRYAFFASLLPPLRYVNAAFRHYPIPLSAPGSPVKARLVGNGSAVNARADLNTWREAGVPVSFRVGADGALFGEDLRRLDGPRYAEGHLPIVALRYSHGGADYTQEVFAAVEPRFAERAAVCVRLAASGGTRPVVSADAHDEGTLKEGEGTLLDARGRVVAWFDDAWSWDAGARRLIATFVPGGAQAAHLVLFTDPLPAPPPVRLTGAAYAAHRRACVEEWESLLRRGIDVNVPEPLVNNAWKSLVVGTFVQARGDMLCYSVGNAYERLYEAECGDAVRALLLYGHDRDARRMMGPLLDYRQRGVAYHDAAFKLQLLAHHYWLTRDASLLRETRPKWSAEADRIVKGREPESGLLPRENYCGDIDRQVTSLNSNANAWRGLRDIAAVLDAIGEGEESKRLAAAARDFRRAILAAVAKSERRDVQPPFVPIALFGEESPYETLTASTIGSYWDLMAPYVLGSGVFGPGDERERWILDTLHERGGVCMGMIRFDQHSGVFANTAGLDDLYGLRYVDTLLRRDDVDRVLISFYGKLAQGLTRDTFLGAEGTGLVPMDEFGRGMYLPPNSASNALLLWTLRGMLVQDLDGDDDGRPETLRLLFATPRPWLADGASIRIDRAPTAFGEMSLRAESRLAAGEVAVEVTAPPRAPERMLLRVRVPQGWRIVSADARDRRLSVDERGTADVTGIVGRVMIRFRVERE